MCIVFVVKIAKINRSTMCANSEYIQANGIQAVVEILDYIGPLHQ